jgi:Fe-S-cluster containining protein
MDSTPFETVFNLPKPQCCSNGDCCKGASPSTPAHKLWEKAAAGEEFARNFFSIFQPYASHEEAKKVVPGLVERTLKAAEKSLDFESADDVVFYHCRNLLPNNLCAVHEDRPQFCRDYPDTPFVVMAPGCAFEEWGKACKAKYQTLREDLDTLKALQQSVQAGHTSALNALPLLSELLASQGAAETVEWDALTQANWQAVLSLTPLYLASPMGGWLR